MVDHVIFGTCVKTKPVLRLSLPSLYLLFTHHQGKIRSSVFQSNIAFLKSRLNSLPFTPLLKSYHERLARFFHFCMYWICSSIQFNCYISAPITVSTLSEIHGTHNVAKLETVSNLEQVYHSQRFFDFTDSNEEIAKYRVSIRLKLSIWTNIGCWTKIEHSTHVKRNAVSPCGLCYFDVGCCNRNEILRML